MNSVPLDAACMAASLFFVTGGRWELNPQETCSTDMPDIPIVGTATVGAPGATRKPPAADHGSAALPFELQVQSFGAGSGVLTHKLCRLNFSSTDTSSTFPRRLLSGAGKLKRCESSRGAGGGAVSYPLPPVSDLPFLRCSRDMQQRCSPMCSVHVERAESRA